MKPTAAHYWRTRTVRRAAQDWHAAKASGTLLVALYMAGFTLLVVASLLQTYAPPLAEAQALAQAAAVTHSWTLGAVVASLWLSALLTRRTPIATGPDSALMLRLPLGRLPTLAAALLGSHWAWLAGAACTLLRGALLGVGSYGAALATALAARPLFAAAGYHTRIEGEQMAFGWLVLAALLPLVGLPFPMLTLPLTLVGMGLAAWQCTRLSERLGADSLLHMQVAGMRATFARLQLPLPPMRPDGLHPPRLWRRPVHPRTPARAQLWRGWLSLTQRPWLLLWGLPVGAGLALCTAFYAALSPIQAPAVIMLLAGLLTKTLPLVPDLGTVPLPLSGWEARLLPLLPAAATTALATLVGAGMAAALLPLGLSALGSAALATQLATLPLSALTLQAYLGQGGTAFSRSHANLSAGLLPVAISVLSGPWLAGWGGALLLAALAVAAATLAARG